jgi:hypothetical protein
MKTKSTFLSTILVLTVTAAYSQKAEQDSTFRRHFIGSSAFIIANVLPDPPSFYQLNYGYWLTKKDVISVEAITWKYHAPLGIPYGPSFESSDEAYPGYVKEFGLGIAYQRYFWKGLYSAVHATPFMQQYRNEEKKRIQKGFQLFLTLRVGYHIKLFQNRFFIKPSLAFTHWPINTNVPEPFGNLESKWPNYFLFEPGFHFGIKL